MAVHWAPISTDINARSTSFDLIFLQNVQYHWRKNTSVYFSYMYILSSFRLNFHLNNLFNNNFHFLFFISVYFWLSPFNLSSFLCIFLIISPFNLSRFQFYFYVFFLFVLSYYLPLIFFLSISISVYFPSSSVFPVILIKLQHI